METYNLSSSTESSPDAGNPGFQYGQYFPLISGVLMWAVIITMFVLLKQACSTCVRRLRKCYNSLSRLLGETRPFSYCWTHVEMSSDSRRSSHSSAAGSYSRNNSIISYLSPPPEYSIAVDMPKPEHHNMQNLNSRNATGADITRHDHGIQNQAFVNNAEDMTDTREDAINETNVDSHEDQEESQTLHIVYTETQLPSYDEAIASYEIINESSSLEPLQYREAGPNQCNENHAAVFSLQHSSDTESNTNTDNTTTVISNSLEPSNTNSNGPATAENEQEACVVVIDTPEVTIESQQEACGSEPPSVTDAESIQNNNNTFVVEVDLNRSSSCSNSLTPVEQNENHC